MSKHRDSPIALGRQPIELDDAPFADERLVAVPRIVAAFERQQGSGDRWHLDDNVVQIARGSQQSQPAAGLIPDLVHVNEDGYDLGNRIRVALPVGGTAPAADRGDGGPSRELDIEFALERFPKRIAVEFIQQRSERWTKRDLIHRKTARR